MGVKGPEVSALGFGCMSNMEQVRENLKIASLMPEVAAVLGGDKRLDDAVI